MKIIFLLSICLLMACSQTQAKQLKYPTVKDIYEDCRIAVEAVSSDKDYLQFINTLCGRQMNGVVNGLYMIYGILQPPTINLKDPNNAHDKKQKELYDAMMGLYCFPRESYTQELPEFTLAKHLIKAYEKDKKHDDAGLLNMNYLLQKMYSCPNN